ncbi:MAG: hypothetical protein K2Y42_19600 [Hyphomicrobium sp.]|jgi:hypothetical protein|uniref:hypothetical protein n=1 Tax=Hyphomicrobium sp. TaxID=82 RepID=UPI0025C4DDD9|nr:hypothetical protein [Hyphomicrobium sp.]MBX9864953.1 hypothetical protein [Hyphomicrobium sp.]
MWNEKRQRRNKANYEVVLVGLQDLLQPEYTLLVRVAKARRFQSFLCNWAFSSNTCREHANSQRAG